MPGPGHRTRTAPRASGCGRDAGAPRGSGHLALHGQMRKQRADLDAAHLARVTLAVEHDESARLPDVRLLGSNAEETGSDFVPDVRAIREFVARDAPGVAEVLADRVFGAVGRLEQFPLSGREVPEFGRPDLREVILGSYRIVHRVRSEEQVEVLTVVHSAPLHPGLGARSGAVVIRCRRTPNPSLNGDEGHAMHPAAGKLVGVPFAR